MTRLWQPPVGMRIAPGQLEGHRQAECDRCHHVGASTPVRERAQDEADAHRCDPRDVERVRLRIDIQRHAVVAVPSEGGQPLYGRRGRAGKQH